jgi:hypothetical protein
MLDATGRMISDCPLEKSASVRSRLRGRQGIRSPRPDEAMSDADEKNARPETLAQVYGHACGGVRTLGLVDGADNRAVHARPARARGFRGVLRR